MVSPPAGMALYPPVPQPPLTYRLRIGVGPHDGGRVRRDIHDAGPLPHQLETAERGEQLEERRQVFLEQRDSAPLCIAAVGIGATTDDEFAAIGLAHVHVNHR